MPKLNECLIAWEKGGAWNAMAFDGVKVEAHSGNNIVTQYPVSKGFNVSEHTIRQNARIQIDAVLSNFSMPVATERQSFEAAFAAVTAAAGYIVSLNNATKYGRLAWDNATAKSGQVSMNKVETAFAKIKELTQLGTLVHIITMRSIYTNCVVREYMVANDVTNSYSLPITLKLEELIVIDSEGVGDLNAALDDSAGNPFWDDMSGVI